MRVALVSKILLVLGMCLIPIGIGVGLDLLPVLLVVDMPIDSGKRVVAGLMYMTGAAAGIGWGLMLKHRMWPFFESGS